MESKETSLTHDDFLQYNRQMLLSEVSREGQEKIKSSSVLIIGAGSLGSACIYYLAGAGVGTIGIVDEDKVELSYLHRQIIHLHSNIGMNKAKSAGLSATGLNPSIKLEIYEERFSAQNCLKIAEKYEIIVDCTDNDATKYLISDTAVLMSKPLISGFCLRWEGKLAIYHKASRTQTEENLPCLRCISLVPTPDFQLPKISDVGTFGPVSGVIGSLQAAEVLKVILGLDEKVLGGKQLRFNCLDYSFRIEDLKGKSKDCPVCGEKKSITKESIVDYDYNAFVQKIDFAKQKIEESLQIQWKDLYSIDKEGCLFLDVRSEAQNRLIRLPDFPFEHVQLRDLVLKFEELEKSKFPDKEQKIFVCCRTGLFAIYATNFLTGKGYSNVKCVKGGLKEYKAEINSEIEFYQMKPIF